MSNRATIGIYQFLTLLERLGMQPDYPYKFSWQIMNGLRPVEYARNRLVGAFLKNTKAERLWFIDEDMLPTQTSLELLDVDADIVAGRAWAFDHPNGNRGPSLKLCIFDYNKLGDYKFNPVVPENGSSVMDVTAAGTATMLISRAVLEDPRMNLPGAYTGLDGIVHSVDVEREADDWAPPVFRTLYKPNGHILRGEDLDFCLRAHELGYSIKAHVGSEFGHLKEVNLNDVAAMAEAVARRVASTVGNAEARAGRSDADTNQVA
jgi:hypothetical protein